MGPYAPIALDGYRADTSHYTFIIQFVGLGNLTPPLSR